MFPLRISFIMLEIAFRLVDLSIVVSGVLKSATIIVLLLTSTKQKINKETLNDTMDQLDLIDI